jgi:hypothetical protein
MLLVGGLGDGLVFNLLAEKDAKLRLSLVLVVAGVSFRM